ncbi:hypothetical protein [Halomarina oriensis]|uniref:DUF7979 domain-containing protein n=1 Tax=Halomarina oriensis TaxID=671145 RepID=A0A6B0GGG5_9EURY|nr:hypothetical protein [Halomarina oriensis]MWG33610.1 hypothetical protein [Halomarina oriensis]
MNRRSLLASLSLAPASMLAGCSGSCSQGFFGTSMPHDGEIAVERTDTVPEQATIIQFSELPDAEQSILQTAVEDGVVRACLDDDDEKTSAMRSFSNRMKGEETYLVYNTNHYALGVRMADEVYGSGTAPLPESDVDPCC